MTTQNPESTADQPVSEDVLAAVPAPAPAAPVFQPLDAKRRLRELLSVPERERSDEQWDEIIELEIQLAPGNRIAPNESFGSMPTGGGGGRNQKPRGPKSGAQHGGGQHGSGGGNNPAAAAGSGSGQPKQHRPRTSNNRRPRQNKNPSSTGGGGGGSPAA